MLRLLAIGSAILSIALLFGWNAGHCTGWFDRLLVWDWSDCCAAHDSDYAIGIVKVIADYFLRTCTNAALPGMGEVMWWGVAVIGGAVSKWFYDKAQRERQVLHAASRQNDQSPV